MHANHSSFIPFNLKNVRIIPRGFHHVARGTNTWHIFSSSIFDVESYMINDSHTVTWDQYCL